MNQLVRADDNVSHKTYVYTYDVGGNRTATKIYDFTLETLEGEPTVITQTYGFDLDSNVMRWNDRLKTYNGKQIIYDLEGNPVSYGGKTLNWYGKQLKQVTAADGSYTQYDYDANGLRTQKRQYKADGTTDYTVDYVWSDGKIAVQSLTYPLTMTIQGNTVTRDIKIDSKFIYCDDDTTPSAIMLENDEYLLVRNLQGDVVAVVNAANGETVVEFSYDPWGNVTRKYSETYTDGATEEELKLLDLVMSALCPVTYRGYNYDFTTGLYYLQSRYYNPEWGRFLNTDDTSIMLTKTDDAFSANMYLYCNNNPVNKVDYDGYWRADVHQGFFDEVPLKLFDVDFVLCNDVFVPIIYKNGQYGEYETYGTYFWAVQTGYSDYCAKQLAYWCNEVDSIFSPLNKSTQNFHFNVNKGTNRKDSRLELFTLFYLAAYESFNIATQYRYNGADFKFREYRDIGFVLLGFALHPIQDMYAHTDDKVYLDALGYWSHVLNIDTDSASSRPSQLNKTKKITKDILSEIKNNFIEVCKSE